MADVRKNTALIVAGRLLSANTDVNDRVAAYNTIQALVEKLSEAEAEKLAIAQRFDEFHPDPALMARIIMTSIERDCQNQELSAKLEAAETALATADKLASDLQDLINNSAGVAGLHMNGDLAEWDTLTAGGNFEAWLRSLSEYIVIRALTTEGKDNE